MPDELKPCPFCGREAEIDSPDVYEPEISCDGCNVVMRCLSRKDLIARWNKRTFRIAQASGVIPEAFKDER